LDYADLAASMARPGLVYDVWGVFDGKPARLDTGSLYRRLGSAAALRAADV
jgi:hypothetical protein